MPPPPTKQEPPSYKLVVLGESAVGKSSLLLRFVKDQFHEFQESTIGAAFLVKTMERDDGAIKFEIWDTAGQERYQSLAPMYYRKASVALVVYDITNIESYVKAQGWVSELRKNAEPNILIALVGNKQDLSPKREKLTQKKIPSCFSKFQQKQAPESCNRSPQLVFLFCYLASKMPRHTQTSQDKTPVVSLQSGTVTQQKKCC